MDEKQTQTPEPVASIATVSGEPYTKLPDDLYIPPDALEVFLDTFEGPLDLLLYLIKRHNVDILDIPIAEITRQYIDYVELMKSLQLELAAEYLVMAAALAEIKSRMLLPRHEEDAEDEDDPRAELIRRLQEYERFKQAATDLDELPRLDRDIFIAKIEPPEFDIEVPLPDIDMHELVSAFKQVLKRADLKAHHHIQREVLSIRERMSIILDKLQQNRYLKFENLFTLDEGRMGVVVSFIAILELVKQHMIQIVQTEPYSPIHVATTD